MGNSCTSIGCSNDSLKYVKRDNENNQPENDRINPLIEKGSKPHISYLNIKYVNSNNADDINKKTNLNGNRVLMYVKEIPTKVVKEKLRKQQLNENFGPNSITKNNLNYKDDFQHNSLVKSKGDFDKDIDNDRRLFSKSLVGKSSLNKRSNGFDAGNIKNYGRKTNHFINENGNVRNKKNSNNNNDILFIYGSEKSNGNKSSKDTSIWEDSKPFFQKVVKANDSNQFSDGKETVALVSQTRKNPDNDWSEKLKHVKSDCNREAKEANDPRTKEDSDTLHRNHLKDDACLELDSRCEQSKPEVRTNNRTSKKVVFMEKSEIENNGKNMNAKESVNNKTKLADLNMEIIKYEKSKRTNLNNSIDNANCSIFDNPNVQSFYLKNKNFEKPDEVVVFFNFYLQVRFLNL